MGRIRKLSLKTAVMSGLSDTLEKIFADIHSFYWVRED